MAESRNNPPDERFDAGKRKLIRKAVYSAPALVVLGFAAHSPQARAQFNPPPSAPKGQAAQQPTEDDLLLQDLERRD